MESGLPAVLKQEGIVQENVRVNGGCQAQGTCWETPQGMRNVRRTKVLENEILLYMGV